MKRLPCPPHRLQPARVSGIIAVTILLVVGIKESANFNTAIVFVKLIAVIVFIGVAGMFVIKHPDSRTRIGPFLPKNTGAFGEFGWSGVLRGAGVIFFAYIGFDAVSTAAQEAKNPQEGHAHRHPRLAGHLHRALHPGLRPAHRRRCTTRA